MIFLLTQVKSNISSWALQKAKHLPDSSIANFQPAWIDIWVWKVNVAYDISGDDGRVRHCEGFDFLPQSSH